MKIKITVPLCPSVNCLYGGGSGQKRFPSKAYKKWKQDAGIPHCFGLLIPKCSIEYRFFFPDNRRRDCENFSKALSDWLVANKVIQDDAWQCVTVLRLLCGGIDKQNPRTEISIERIDDD